MNCLYCGEPLEDSQRDAAEWHPRCIRVFFGTHDMPQLHITPEQIQKLVEKAIHMGATVAGVQKKLSLHLSTQEGSERLTLKDHPFGYILKPQTKEFQALPEAEDLSMRMAKATGIQTVLHGLIRVNDESASLAYITKRADREIKESHGHYHIKKYAMEDFCQLSDRLTQYKYRGSYEQCAKIIWRYSSTSGLDLSELFFRVVFSFVIGNSDMHLKNLSLIETSPASRVFTLSPAYDLLPVNVVLPEDQDEMALTLNGKKSNISRRDFLRFAANAKIQEKTALNLLEKVISMKDEYLQMTAKSLLPEHMKEALKMLVLERIRRLQ
ncbi:MAG TPA: HipA domain-containing protein [Tissierellia bacterium]|jgi:serine/threonine-protein kinase HipA|nr:HipA domain-containing protein [Tissierellia bacterium]